MWLVLVHTRDNHIYFGNLINSKFDKIFQSSRRVCPFVQFFSNSILIDSVLIFQILITCFQTNNIISQMKPQWNETHKYIDNKKN